MRVEDIPELGRLSTQEKILLVQDLWDSIASDPSSVPVRQSHKDELHRRLLRREAPSGCLLTLDELQARIESRT